jgi:hypothetical protein
MITKLWAVYAGHVGLVDMGQMATPADERCYSNEHLASVFDKTEAIAQCMDEHGYYTMWLAELAVRITEAVADLHVHRQDCDRRSVWARVTSGLAGRLCDFAPLRLTRSPEPLAAELTVES